MSVNPNLVAELNQVVQLTQQTYQPPRGVQSSPSTGAQIPKQAVLTGQTTYLQSPFAIPVTASAAVAWTTVQNLPIPAKASEVIVETTGTAVSGTPTVMGRASGNSPAYSLLYGTGGNTTRLPVQNGAFQYEVTGAGFTPISLRVLGYVA